ncbi:hypothetical protein ASG31_04320 [Chryseobacterium sp. Leaf404]|uniref:hypothetical protein n=1 Tax=unclassified Chryseobacterium TaxID=2593645 RepID=UPI0006F5BBC3|nr:MULTISPECIES: hypothetical protein [unclassified Chryseobacterium]KQT17968.1 hypothetical protein ASG31_04320 [Chryseobacterium sp. Leaf404]
MKTLIGLTCKVLSVVLIILAFLECKNGDKESMSSDSVESSKDSTQSSGIDSTQTSLDTLSIKPDSLITNKSIENNISLADDIRANTAVYAPQEMTKNQTYTVFAMVSLKEIALVKKRLIEHADKLNDQKILETDIKYAKTTFSTNKIKVSLKCDDEVFKIIDSDDGIIKAIDDKNDEIFWKWHIKAKNYTSKSPLIFIFQSVDNDEVLFEQQFDVDVNVSVKNTFGGYFQYLADELKYTIPSIILPLITFVYGVFLRKRKSAKKEV